jgi:hypothetical protein
MLIKIVAPIALGSLFAGAAFAQTNPPVDPQSKTNEESPTTMGSGAGNQAPESTAGQNPATDPVSDQDEVCSLARSAPRSVREDGERAMML